jgi:hypothetical protein
MKTTKYALAMALGFLCLLLPGSLRADTTYTYAGNAYTSCTGTYASSGTTCAGPYALTVTFDTTLSGAQLDHLAIGTVLGGDLTPYVSKFDFTDGTGVTITEKSTGVISSFDVTTDGAGAITSWYISAASIAATSVLVAATCHGDPTYCASQSYDETDVNIISGATETLTANGDNFGGSSTWSSPVATPEPGTGILMLTGIGLVLVMRKRIGQGLRLGS